jgi:hypothetical protein
MPNVPVVKVVIAHRGASLAKFGTSGWRRIRHAVTALVASDRTRGITTRLYTLDSASDANKVHAQVVTAPGDVAAIKAAIDQINATWQPSYLLLLGGPDLVGTVNLANPLWTGDPQDDPDQFIPSDLPYTCDGPLTFSPGDYRGPTRVVGRIADLVGDSDPDALLVQLSAATLGTSLVRRSPQPVFAVSARVWQRSTALSVGALPEAAPDLHTAPADGPAWTAAQTAPPLHFVNCHGGEFDPKWYGQAAPNNWNLPPAIDAATLPGLVAPGTVVASECCYGIAHWPPSAAHGQASVAMTYLRQGAVGVFGSSTVAYGPSASNAYADVLCRLFLAEVLAGASLGRAVLAARQQFVQGQAFLDPTDLKTLAQFNLLGDPAAVPLVTTATAAGPKSRRSATVATPPTSAAVVIRRNQLGTIGAALARSTFACANAPVRRATLTAGALADLVGAALPEGVRVRTFLASAPSQSDARAGMAFAHSARIAPRAHVAYVARRGGRPPSLIVVREAGAAPEVRVLERR